MIQHDAFRYEDRLRDEHEATQAQYDRYMAKKANGRNNNSSTTNNNNEDANQNKSFIQRDNRPSAGEAFDFFTKVWDKESGNNSSSVKSPKSEQGSEGRKMGRKNRRASAGEASL